MKKTKTLIGILGICLLFSGTVYLKNRMSDVSSEEKKVVERVLSTLTADEKEKMRALFAHLFFFEQCAYPLFGTKPMSIARLAPTEEARIGWAAWKKVALTAHSENIIIREFTHKGYECALVVNLNAAHQVYLENQDAFGKINWEALKSCLEKDGELFQELIDDHLLMGILLGYGRGNAELFCSQQEHPDQVLMQPFASSHPIFHYFSPVMPVYFGCNPHSEETAELKRRYKYDRDKIIQMARREDLFTRMLILLFSQ
jgi:hypothetical protein